MAAVSELTHDKDGYLKCKDCPRRFLTEFMFENHSSNEHKKETKTKLHKNHHSQTIKEEISFRNNTQSEEELSLGNVSFSSQVDLTMQSNEHQKTFHHKYNECKKLSDSEINLKKHLLNGHPLSLQESKECNREFSTKTILQTNAVYKGWKHYKCLLCNCSYVNRYGLKNHIDAVHKKLTPYQCKECKKYFTQISTLKNHIDNVHKKLTPYQCKECKKSFALKGNLKRHNDNVHNKLTPYQCKECTKSFGQKSHLMRHVNLQHKY